jgi:hypothetical protein
VSKAKSSLIKLFITREQSLNQSSIRQIAPQSKVYELGSLILTNWSETVASGRGQRKKGRSTLTRRPGAYLAGMARQCPRGRPGATEGRSSPSPHREHHTLVLPPASAREAQAPEHSQHAQQAPAARHRIGGARRRQIPRGEINPISSERRRPAILFGGAGRGRGVEHFAQDGGNSGHRS